MWMEIGNVMKVKKKWPKIANGLASERKRWRKMRYKVDNEIVIDYLKSMKMENHPNFNFLFVSIKLNHSVCHFLYSITCRKCDAAIWRGSSFRVGFLYAIPCHHLTNYSLFNFIIQAFSMKWMQTSLALGSARRANYTKQQYKKRQPARIWCFIYSIGWENE